MKSSQELKKQLRQIDHKGYKAYKVLEGEYDFGAYRLCIDHVQGDPFATPSRVRIVYKNEIPVKFLTGHTEGLPQKMRCCADCMEIYSVPLRAAGAEDPGKAD